MTQPPPPYARPALSVCIGGGAGGHVTLMRGPLSHLFQLQQWDHSHPGGIFTCFVYVIYLLSVLSLCPCSVSLSVFCLSVNVKHTVSLVITVILLKQHVPILCVSLSLFSCSLGTSSSATLTQANHQVRPIRARPLWASAYQG